MTIAKHASLYAFALLAPILSCAFAGERDELDDLIARIQFNSYAADSRALQSDLSALQRRELADELLVTQRYYLGYGYLKLAEALREQDRSAGRKASGACIEVLTKATDNEPKRTGPQRERARIDQLYAELWAMQGACAALEAELSLLPGSASISVSSFKSSKASDKALALAPNNPRVKLLTAVQEARRAKSSADQERAARQLETVAAMFDAAPAAPALGSNAPDWGQAEALAWLGQVQLKRGDKVAARNTLERALVLAPDYVWAKNLLAQLQAP